MKAFQKFSLVALACTIFAGITSCEQYKGIETGTMVPVETLLSPSDGVNVVLTTASDASVFFEWDEVSLSDGSMVLYEVVFTSADGDISEPLYRVPSDNKGLKPYLSLSHKQLNKVAAAIGYGAGETGSMKWTVVTSKGVGEKFCQDSRTITVTRLNGFADVPEIVSLSGDATEYGSESCMFKVGEDGEFSMYTKLEAGKEFHIYSSSALGRREFYLDGTILKEGENANTVSETGVYKLSLDFYAGVASFARIEAVYWYHCNSSAAVLEIPYAGKGTWSLAKHVMTEADFGTESPEYKNPRYRFQMQYSDGTITYCGPSDVKNDAAPTGAEAYYYAEEYTIDDVLAVYAENQVQFNPKWKRVEKNTVSWIGYVYNIALIFNPEGIYTHVLEPTTAEEGEGGDPEDTDKWPDTAPTELFISGTAPEVTPTMAMKSIGEGKFELFARLSAGKTLYFSDAASSPANTYSIQDGELRLKGETTVTDDGVYKVSFDFGSRKASLKKIASLMWYHCNSATANIPLSYIGEGVWKISKHIITDEDMPGTEATQKNPRYRFEMIYADGTHTYWGPADITCDVAPTGDDSYYYAREYTKEEILSNYSEAQLQFNPKWKNAVTECWVGNVYDFSLTLKADAPYSHSISKGELGDVIPEQAFITGEASEGGTNIGNAVKMKALGDGKFEAYTKLERGKSFSFIDAISGSPNTFSFDGATVKKGGSSQVDTTGIYKIQIDFDAKSISMSRILSVKWYHCNSGTANLELNYSGNGVWSVSNHEMTDDDVPGAGTENNKKNPRYHFRMEYSDHSITVWGPVDPSCDSTPTGEDSYFYAKEYDKISLNSLFDEAQQQFNPKWKRSQGNTVSWVGFKYDMNLILSSEGEYRHELIEK